MDSGSSDDAWREDCAPRRVMELFATKWTSMVLHTLHARHGGRCRSGALLRSLPGISKKMLTQTLRDMEASGLIERRVHDAVPPTVDYGLTVLGARSSSRWNCSMTGDGETPTPSTRSRFGRPRDGGRRGASSIVAEAPTPPRRWR